MQAFAVDKGAFRTILELRQVKWLRQALGMDFHAMRLLRTMQRIDHAVQEDLDQIRAVDLRDDILTQRMDDEFVLLRGGVNFQEFAQVGQDLAGADGRLFGGALAQETEIALRDFDAIVDLPGDAGQPVLHQIQAAAFESGGAADVLVDYLDETRDDGQRPVDVVNDAGINLALGANDFLLQLLVVQFFLQLAQLLIDGAHLLGDRVPFHGGGDGGAHGGNIERLGQVIASPQPQRLPRRFYRLVSR